LISINRETRGHPDHPDVLGFFWEAKWSCRRLAADRPDDADENPQIAVPRTRRRGERDDAENGTRNGSAFLILENSAASLTFASVF
jgi:hypothetical protein